MIEYVEKKDSVTRASTLSGDHQATAGQPTDGEIIAAFMSQFEDDWFVNYYEQAGVAIFDGKRRSLIEASDDIKRLGLLHKVEAKVLDIISLREKYYWQMGAILFSGEPWAEGVTEYFALLHATAEQKIKALAAVLRTQVTK